jgi:DNA-binding transcriptional MocR family regulator
MTQLAITQITPPDGRIRLSIGQPDPGLLPEQLFQQMSADALSLAYGAEMGDGRFRESLADWLSRQYTEPVKPESLMVTNGSSNALDMICARFTRPGDVVLVEDPTYFIARRQFADHGLAIIAAPMDNDGVDIHTLERLVKVHTPAFFYTVPTFHNPTGRTLTAERRAMLTTLRNENDAARLLPAAVNAGVDFLPGKEFSGSPDQAGMMRLCFAYYDIPRLEEACKRLGQVFE